ncbi:hypothetical protein PPL_00454 [Heterostelium album PN500]|uniref:Uncharacterized protein n=1 Tax=Heterostelium pallidum (strain ATCC 26659 / Pp 5 / PN500) TaxID=670386 RepID=D3AWI0_HETP5|nr:hypothetical protein PPL_00454 [Heterostelium album PN500]EFA86653.1 hypothetical protein PPL_00454 [Heterostelium album PN500]|eukprot:XP_020438758.1 hypothetical protein PPL_00454 [Heterostelium album PN500]
MNYRNNGSSFILILIFLLFCTINYTFSLHFELNDASKLNERLIKGKDELESILVKSKRNECWQQCIESLKNGCKDMDDIERSRLAVKLTNCHLEKSGLNSYRCNEKMSIPECTSTMSELTSLKTQLEQSMDYLNRITTQSDDLKQSLRDTTLKQDNLLQSQKQLSEQHQQSSKISLDLLSQIKDTSNFISSNTMESLDNQNRLLSLQKEAIGDLNGIGEITESCLAKQKEIMISQDRIAQSNQIIVGILDGLTTISNSILSEFIDFKSLIYYLLLFIFIYFVTSQKKTQSARIPLYAGLIVQLFVERYIAGGSSFDHLIPQILVDLIQLDASGVRSHRKAQKVVPCLPDIRVDKLSLVLSRLRTAQPSTTHQSK